MRGAKADEKGGRREEKRVRRVFIRLLGVPTFFGALPENIFRDSARGRFAPSGKTQRVIIFPIMKHTVNGKFLPSFFTTRTLGRTGKKRGEREFLSAARYAQLTYRV